MRDDGDVRDDRVVGVVGVVVSQSKNVIDNRLLDMNLC